MQEDRMKLKQQHLQEINSTVQTEGPSSSYYQSNRVSLLENHSGGGIGCCGVKSRKKPTRGKTEKLIQTKPMVNPQNQKVDEVYV